MMIFRKVSDVSRPLLTMELTRIAFLGSVVDFMSQVRTHLSMMADDGR
jgi:hypothetical protein